MKTEKATQKVIYLISTPRSCSTPFLRMMHARGDFEVINEPGALTYCSLYLSPRSSWNPLVTFQKVQNFITQKSVEKNVFVKELGFGAHKYLLVESDFLKLQNYCVVFLIRNPHHVLISFYKKINKFASNEKLFARDVLNDLMSYKKLYELFQNFQQKMKKQPLIIFSEELVANPTQVVTHFCQQVDISFKKESLSWQKLDERFSFEREWNCFEPVDVARHWYDKAMASTEFTPESLLSYAVDEHGQPTFEEIENLEHRKLYKQLYDENLPYYKLFFEKNNQKIKMVSSLG